MDYATATVLADDAILSLFDIDVPNSMSLPLVAKIEAHSTPGLAEALVYWRANTHPRGSSTARMAHRYGTTPSRFRRRVVLGLVNLSSLALTRASLPSDLVDRHYTDVTLLTTIGALPVSVSFYRALRAAITRDPTAFGWLGDRLSRNDVSPRR